MLNLLALAHVVTHDFILGSVAHVTDLRLDISEHGLQKLIFLLQDKLVV